MIDRLRILLVEDSPTDAKLVTVALRRMTENLEVERVDHADAMREAIARGPWDAIICDWSMPRFSAIEALAVARETGLDLPFILVSGTIGEEAAVEAMRAGAHDYVLKDKLTRLVPALERELRESAHRREARRVEQAMRLQESRFRALIESSTDAIVLGGGDGRMLYVSPALTRMTGYPNELLVGHHPTEFVVTEDRARLAEVMERVRQTGRNESVEFRALHLDGSRPWLEVSIASKLDDPAIAALVVNVRDLTERKRGEEALRSSESQLRQAQKMEAVGRLAGGVAHDFNNVLSVILSYGELMFEALSPGDPLREDVTEVINAGKRAADITRQLLMFSRQQVIEPRILDLSDLLGSMHRMLARLLGEDIELVLNMSTSLGHVRADPSSLEQVIMNLVVNARDAMPTGGRLIIETSNVVLDESFARTHVGLRPGRHVALSVCDSGTGIDPATQARIFEPFFTTKEVGRGTGLGLSMVFGIAQQCGGAVWVDSELGKGSTFTLYLPRIDRALASILPHDGPSTLRGDETILLVEDEEQVRVVARNILKKHGYRVLEARHPDEGLMICEAHEGPIHLLLSDVVMPRISGPELARRLLVMRPTMRVLCMSGYTDERVAPHGAIGEGLPFIQKPITPTSLSKRVREVLDGPLQAAVTRPG